MKFPSKAITVLLFLALNSAAIGFIFKLTTVVTYSLLILILSCLTLYGRAFYVHGNEAILIFYRRNKLYDTFKASFAYLRINRRFIFITTIGLVLAISSISQPIFYSSSFESVIVDELFSTYKSSDPDISITFAHGVIPTGDTSTTHYSLNYPIIVSQIEYVKTKIEDATESTGEKEIIKQENFLVSTHRSEFYMSDPANSLITYDFDEDFVPVILFGATDFLFEFLSGYIVNGSIPTSSTELLILQTAFSEDYAFDFDDTLSQIILNEHLNLHSINYDLDNVSQSVGLEISGRAYLDTNDTIREVSQYLNDQFWLHQPILFCRINDFDDILNRYDIEGMNLSLEWNLPLSILHFYYAIEIQKGGVVDPFNVEAFRDRIRVIRSKLYQSLSYHAPYIELSSFYDYDVSYDYSMELLFIKALLLILSMPAIGVALFLVIFSFGIVGARKRNLVSIMKTRGFSSSQVTFTFIIEILLSTVIAVILGCILGYLLAVLSLRTNDFLDFSGDNRDIIIHSRDLWGVIIFSFVLCIDITIPHVLSLSKTEVLVSLAPTEKEDPRWQKYYIDIALVVVSYIAWLANKSLMASEGGGFRTINYIIGPFTPFVFLVGSMLFFSRIFPYFIDAIASLLWYTRQGLLSFSFKAILNRKNTISRLMSLVAVSIALILFTMIIPFTVKNHLEEMEKYETGSDLLLDGINVFSEEVRLKLNNYTEFEWSPIYHFNGTSLNGISHYDITVINSSSYKNAAFWKESFFDSSIDSLMDSLKANNTILVYKDDMNKVGLSVGGYLSLPSGFQSILMKVVGSFNYFSNFSRSMEVSEEELSYKIVMSYETFFTYYFYFIDGLVYDHNNNWRALVKLNSGVDRAAIISDLQENLDEDGIIVIDALEEMNEILDSNLSPYKVVFAIVNADFIISLSTIIISMLLFTLLVINERKEELGLYKALGMVRRQLSILFLTEIIAVLIFSLLIGNLMGYILSKMFIESFQYGIETQLPIELYFPLGFFIKINAIIIIGSLLVTLVPSFITSRKETATLLRRE